MAAVTHLLPGPQITSVRGRPCESANAPAASAAIACASPIAKSASAPATCEWHRNMNKKALVCFSQSERALETRLTQNRKFNIAWMTTTPALRMACAVAGVTLSDLGVATMADLRPAARAVTAVMSTDEGSG